MDKIEESSDELNHFLSRVYVSPKHATSFSSLPSILLILVGVELPLCVVVTLSQNVVLCFLESS